MNLPELSFLFKTRDSHDLASDFVREDSCHFRLSAKYRLYYRLFRPVMPIFVRQMLQRGRRITADDSWYEPTRFMQLMTSCLKAEGEVLNTIHPWPDRAEFAFVLTHDVETSEGMRHISRIANYEEDLGFRSSWNLVPHKYKIDMGLVKDLQSRGFEIGIHGFNHDGQLYSSRHVFERRAKEISQALKKYGAVGFRSPMVHRNLNWLQSLEIEYDSSCFDVDPFQAAPGGVGSIWPFIAGRFVELPYTLPQDHTLFIALGQNDDQVWRNKLDFIIRHQGMALMLTHPDYLTRRQESDTYFRFLEFVKDLGTFWHATPNEVARWWRRREQAVEFGLEKTSASQSTPGSRPSLANLRLKADGLSFVSR